MLKIYFFCSRYECVDKNVSVQSSNIKISEVDGVFTDGKSHNAVDTVSIGSKLKYIPEMSAVVEKFPNFKRLFIVNSGLKYVERSKLTKLSQLRILNFFGDEIESFDEDVLNDLKHLEIFAFVSNQVKVLPQNLLANQRKLKELWAWSNLIETIPEGFFKNNKELTHIWMSHNKIKTINVDFRELPNVIILDLQSNECIGEQMCSGCNAKTTTDIQRKINEKCGGVPEQITESSTEDISDSFDCFKNGECNFVTFDK
jgi:Leucine-rich repeat (LRR) protein